jgi:hypothetical protein
MIGRKVRFLEDDRIGVIVPNGKYSLPPWASAFIQLENGAIYAYSRNEYQII